jgi:hypothetical protein
VAFKICKAHGWEISYDIEPKLGTTVSVLAPRSV